MFKKSLYFLSCILTFTFTASITAQESTPFTIPENLDIITSENTGSISELVSLDSDIKHISVSPDSSLIAIVTQYLDYDYNISIIDVQTQTVISHMQGRMDSFRDLIWSPNSERIAVISGRTTGSGVEERSVRTYTIETGSNLNYYSFGNSDTWYVDYVDPFPSVPSNPVQMAWNPASNMIAIAFYEKLEVDAVDTNNTLFSTPVPRIETIYWSSDGRMIITKSIDDIITLWGIASHSN